MSSEEPKRKRKIPIERMIAEVRKSPATLSELAKRMDRTPSSLQSHLKMLLDEGTFVRDKYKRYHVKEEAQILTLFLRKLAKGPSTAEDLFQDEELGFHFDTIAHIEQELSKLSKRTVFISSQAIYELTPLGADFVTKGAKRLPPHEKSKDLQIFDEESQILMLQKLVAGGKTLDELFTELNTLKYEDINDKYILEENLIHLFKNLGFISIKANRYFLTENGARRINRCPLCFNPIDQRDKQKIMWFIAGFAPNEMFVGNRNLWWEAGDIHVKCLYRLLLKQLKEKQIEIIDENFCDFCGLPLNPLLLRDFFIIIQNPMRELVRHLTSEEIECIESTKNFENIHHFCYSYSGTALTKQTTPAYLALNSLSDLEYIYGHLIMSNANDIKYRGYFQSIDVGKRMAHLWERLYQKLEENEKKIDYYIEKLCGIPNLFYKNFQVFYFHSKDHHNTTDLIDAFVGESGIKLRNGSGVPSTVDSAHSLIFSDEGNQYHWYCYELQKRGNEHGKVNNGQIT